MKKVITKKAVRPPPNNAIEDALALVRMIAAYIKDKKCTVDMIVLWNYLK